MEQLRGFKYRFYPTSEQRLELAQTFGCSRYVYNWALALRTNSYYQDNVSLSYNDTSNALTKLKKDPEKPWLKQVSAVPLQQGLRHLNTAFLNFFKGECPVLIAGQRWTVNLEDGTQVIGEIIETEPISESERRILLRSC